MTNITGEIILILVVWVLAIFSIRNHLFTQISPPKLPEKTEEQIHEDAKNEINSKPLADLVDESNKRYVGKRDS